MGLAQTDHPRTGGTGQRFRIARGHPTFQQARPGLGRDPGAVDIVLPADRHPVQQAAAQIGLDPVMGRHGLGPGAGSGQPGIDARAVGMGGGGGQIGLGLVQRVEKSGHDGAALPGRRGCQPVHPQKSTAIPFFS